MNTRIRATSRMWKDGIDFMIQEGNSYAVTLSMDTIVEGEIIDPIMTLKNEEAQILMDDLWHAGLRPTEGFGSAGSLAATEKHLADMREIVFDKLNIIKK